MTKQKIIYLLVGVALGSVLGFVLTNWASRPEYDRMRADLARLRAEASEGGGRAPAGTKQPGAGDIPTLSEEQLRGAVARADASPSDPELQRKSGQGLYLYAMQSGNTALLPDAARFLRRAHDADPKDYATLVMLGNALFDLAHGGGGDAARMTEARAQFVKALAIKPDDPDVHTALGLTYFYDRPSDTARAVGEFRKSLALDARNEMALQSLAGALIHAGETDEAGKRIEELQGVNPGNAALPNLRARLEQKKSAEVGEK